MYCVYVRGSYVGNRKRKRDNKPGGKTKRTDHPETQLSRRSGNGEREKERKKRANKPECGMGKVYAEKRTGVGVVSLRPAGHGCLLTLHLCCQGGVEESLRGRKARRIPW